VEHKSTIDQMNARLKKLQDCAGDLKKDLATRLNKFNVASFDLGGFTRELTSALGGLC
jgi:hypothetical protein